MMFALYNANIRYEKELRRLIMEFTTKHYIDLMEEVKPALYKSYELFDKAGNIMQKIENLEKSKHNGKLSFGQILLLILFYLCYFFPGLFFHLHFKSKNKKEDEEIEKQLAILNEELDNVAVEFNSIKLEILTGVHTSNPMLLIQQIVPEDYLFPRPYAFERILSYFKNNRASNPKEAINLYEEELHRERVEYNQLNSLYQQKLQTIGTYANVVANSMNKNN